VAYWRCEEGQGRTVGDVSQNQISLEASDSLVWQLNASNDPLDFEDKWGKRSDANYAISLPYKGLSPTGSGPTLETFTFECWIKFSSTGPELTLMEAPGAFSIKLIQKTLKFTDKQEQEFSLGEELDGWVHIAISAKKDTLEVMIFSLLTEHLETHCFPATSIP